MKKIILFLLTVLWFYNAGKAQVRRSENVQSSFKEFNFGFAKVQQNVNFYFPGISYLWGTTITYQNNFIVEYEGGFAAPSIVTGKVGIGRMFSETKIIAGVRPIPLNFYLQSSFTSGKSDYWIVSIEYNPINVDHFLSFDSRWNLNFGYRWNPKK